MFVHEVSPQGGRKIVAHGVSRGWERPPLPPTPSPAQAGEGVRSGERASFSQGLRPVLPSSAPSGLNCTGPRAGLALNFQGSRSTPAGSKKAIPNFVFLALGRFEAILQKFNPPVGKWPRKGLTSPCDGSIVEDGRRGGPEAVRQGNAADAGSKKPSPVPKHRDILSPQESV
jgi:hypothetical protein